MFQTADLLDPDTLDRLTTLINQQEAAPTDEWAGIPQELLDGRQEPQIDLQTISAAIDASDGKIVPLRPAGGTAPGKD
ncbi:hypothetical protein [Rhodopseudomonas palustris]|uniref:hypothetical protein n=1 Tax=Rhodopseudomonas palustris TaxID=1076 RepID=UPI0011C3D258|nr:hypothetical protein [Rhodopseudomonas palustris]